MSRRIRLATLLIGISVATNLALKNYRAMARDSDAIKEHYAQDGVNVGDVDAIQGIKDGVPYTIWGMKEPDYVMSMMATGGSLTSDDTGAGFLSVTGSDDLSAGFSNLSIIHTFGGIAQVTADLNITGGSLAGVLGGTIGRLEGSLVNVGTFTPGQSLLGLDFSTASPNSTLKLSAVPVPAAVWLFGSGLLGLVGIARRKTRT